MAAEGNRGGGRTKDPIWAHFKVVEVDDKDKTKKRVECSECSQKVSAKPLRMKNHWQKCAATAARNKIGRRLEVETNTDSDSDEETLFSIKNRIRRRRPSARVSDDDENVSVSVISTSSAGTAASSTSNTAIRKRKAQQNIDGLIIKTSKTDKEKLDLAIARCFYSCNIPFNIVGKPYFKKMVETLRPGYQPPNRKELAGGLLNKVYNDSEQELKNYLKGKTFTLMQDGWSNVHNSPVIANCLSDGEQLFFINSIETTTNHKDAAYCLNLAIEVIKLCESKFSCKIKYFVSDNENKMKKMRHDLQTVRNKDSPDNSFISYGCAAHYMNLLGQDICNIKNISSILSQIVELTKYFRNHHVPKGYLNDFDKSLEPQLPGDTRWNSQLTCVKVFLKNREFYCKICTEHSSEIENRIILIASNVGLYVDAKHLHQQLMNIGNGLNKLQSESATIADATHTFITLLQCEDLLPYKTQIKKRYLECITSYHKLAYMLSPKYQAIKLTPEEKETIRNFVSQEINAAFIPFILEFELESHPFPKTMFANSVLKTLTPSQWWKILKKQCLVEKLDENEKSVLNKFLDFAEHLSRCIASSASIERTFSNFNLIQSKTRNRLGMGTVSKLVSAYKMLNAKCPAKSEIYEIDE